MSHGRNFGWAQDAPGVVAVGEGDEPTPGSDPGVNRHVCAKYGLGDASDVPAETREQLREFLRRGLVAYVGAASAETLAADGLSSG